MHIVITGGSRGLGKAIAERFAQKEVLISLCSRQERVLNDTLDDLKHKFPAANFRIFVTDLSTEAGALALAQWILAANQPVDILVNNAGVFEPGSVYNEPDGTLERMLAVNLYSAYYLSRQLIPEMIKRKSGHIFNMCSIASLHAYPNGGSYSISKYALAGFSRNLREELKPYGIKVTAIYPGAAYTDSWAASGINENKLMEAKDIADMVYAAAQLSARACVEDIILRPQGGDL